MLNALLASFRSARGRAAPQIHTCHMVLALVFFFIVMSFLPVWPVGQPSLCFLSLGGLFARPVLSLLEQFFNHLFVKPLVVDPDDGEVSIVGDHIFVPSILEYPAAFITMYSVGANVPLSVGILAEIPFLSLLPYPVRYSDLRYKYRLHYCFLSPRITDRTAFVVGWYPWGGLSARPVLERFT